MVPTLWPVSPVRYSWARVVARREKINKTMITGAIGIAGVDMLAVDGMDELQVEKMGKGKQEFLITALSEGPSIQVCNDGYFGSVVRQVEDVVTVVGTRYGEGGIFLVLEGRR